MSYDGEWKLPRYVAYRMKKSWSKLSSNHLMELEYGIQSGRIIDEQIPIQVLKNPSHERIKNVSITIPLKQSNQNTEQVHAIFDSGGIRLKPFDLQRLWAKGLLRPRKGWIPKHSSSTFDLSKNCAYHSNIQGHDTEECPALRNKIQNMIEKGKIIVQQGPLNNNCHPATTNAIIILGDTPKIIQDT
ncbi:hypothetical protein KY290_007759 [Solanum tuberosum]|uniref:Uncharacterized protein n=1 Tax=Solanum tuberosum TaxID=4113 RepID=A0ABQ7W6H0_SOLTU|nr:hypothetical protein KY290_007759 [Solanum tuberosum]